MKGLHRHRHLSQVHSLMLSPSDFADDARVSGDLTSTVRERVSVRRNKLALVEGAGTQKKRA